VNIGNPDEATVGEIAARIISSQPAKRRRVYGVVALRRDGSCEQPDSRQRRMTSAGPGGRPSCRYPAQASMHAPVTGTIASADQQKASFISQCGKADDSRMCLAW
jgi:hypothetical protein